MKRSDFIQQMDDSSRVWDFIIIGGGATGLGSGLDAAARGYSVLLLEQGDFAEATSSRSTKMVHGGVRYLAQGNISLVMGALRERGILRKNAPHMCYNQKFVVPDYKWWGLPYYGIGLKTYDLLAQKYSFGASRILSARKVQKEIPGVLTHKLKGGVTYHDGQFDDARLALTLARTMADMGGCPLNYTRVTGLVKDSSGYVCGVQAEDKISGKSYELKAKAVINATGIFTDDVMNMDNADHKKLIAPSQGIHIVIDREFLGGETGIMVPKTDDGRVIFFVPWHGKVVVGTTDTPISSVCMEPKPLEEEIDFLVEHSARYLSKPLKRSDVRSVFVGIRPLIAASSKGNKTSALSRDHYLTVSPNKLLTIAGGKWTTYRHMGEDCIDHAIKMGGHTFRPSPTKHLKLHGYTEDFDHNDHMHVYGSEAAEIKALASEFPELDCPMHEKLPYSWLEVVWAARHEWAQTVYDVLSRRTRALILDAKVAVEVAPKAAEILAKELGKDDKWVKEQIEQFTLLSDIYVVK
ncbi:glycerol-3-phosphate dehydrogenase/oxidase [Maridesulfovibrio hydrothermalis]|uniref:FAD dependent oxidoreductase/Glycerol-3-phosphate dehydrogenase n=1 Tax=Maridesulfovibrio hydrothermalis AM13 = DSM 14728 TaxID=1121451 RepID=L0R6N4_9BACT|nr:glycerol-3-phosphate dehydrogenase/oxidase [Maridesulfovibrio hydrothermalis]CCO22374.1 FAD dependent oxidoreductase/Glycerol-3-phosphate dehydrogenase [Maridesulfovibrio hydrothermalis AM13 = DSM 14728]